MEEWVKECLLPNATDEIVLLLESWSGQTDESIFAAVNTKCKRLQIPPKTTYKIQPLDVYFFRQYKIFTGLISGRIVLDQINLDLKNRNNLLRMHSLVYNQLQSQDFTPMLKYAWYVSGYTEVRAGKFLNLKEILFDFENEDCDESMCQNQAFIKCAYCKMHLCFEDFFVKNHYHY